MTYIAHSNIDCTKRDHTNRSLYSLEVEAELERLDREAGRDYLPMDIYMDPRMATEHFQGSSIRARMKRILPSTRRTHYHESASD